MSDAKAPDRKTRLAQEREDAVDEKRDELCRVASTIMCMGGVVADMLLREWPRHGMDISRMSTGEEEARVIVYGTPEQKCFARGIRDFQASLMHMQHALEDMKQALKNMAELTGDPDIEPEPKATEALKVAEGWIESMLLDTYMQPDRKKRRNSTNAMLTKGIVRAVEARCAKLKQEEDGSEMDDANEEAGAPAPERKKRKPVYYGREKMAEELNLQMPDCWKDISQQSTAEEEYNRLKPFPLENPPQRFNLSYAIGRPLTKPNPPRMLTKWELAKLLPEAAELHRQHMQVVASLTLDKIRDRARETTKEDLLWRDLFDRLQREGYPLYTMTPIADQQWFIGSHI
tara:strand:- start:1111 stop:2145 length:1035 start_codon:yes stop_codon:yes gene_type:complete